MHRQTEILQDRIEIAALGRHLGQPPKRTRCEEDEEVEGRRDPGLHRQHVGLEGRRQIDAEQRDQCAEYGEDQHPQQHRALVVAPNAGDLVDQRHLRMRVLVNNGDREVRRDVANGERAKGQRNEGKLRQRGGVGEFHQRNIAHARTDDRRGRLDQRQCKRQYKCVVTKFGDHGDGSQFTSGVSSLILHLP
jgi:hypothetical protein